MRMGRLALPLLVCAMSCSPVREYREAARSLRFHLDRVEPDLRLALPLERSRVVFRVFLGVDNPSAVPFHLLAFAGDLNLETGGARHPIGHLDLARALELPAAGKAQLEVEVTFSYQDLREHWNAIQAALLGGSGAWHLEGTLRAQVHGFPINLPVTSNRSFGNPA